MKRDDILLLGLKNMVTAVEKATGALLWRTELSGKWLSGGQFITLVCDEKRVFAYAGGELFCLDLATGAKLWENGLPGYGYGFATLCVPGHGSAPDPAVVQMMEDEERNRQNRNPNNP